MTDAFASQNRDYAEMGTLLPRNAECCPQKERERSSGPPAWPAPLEPDSHETCRQYSIAKGPAAHPSWTIPSRSPQSLTRCEPIREPTNRHDVHITIISIPTNHISLPCHIVEIHTESCRVGFDQRKQPLGQTRFQSIVMLYETLVGHVHAAKAHVH